MCAYAYTHTRAHAHTRTHHACTHTHTHAHTHTRTHTHTHTHSHTRTHIHTRTHTHAHTHTHTHTHTHPLLLLQSDDAQDQSTQPRLKCFKSVNSSLQTLHICDGCMYYKLHSCTVDLHDMTLRYVTHPQYGAASSLNFISS